MKKNVIPATFFHKRRNSRAERENAPHEKGYKVQKIMRSMASKCHRGIVPARRTRAAGVVSSSEDEDPHTDRA